MSTTLEPAVHADALHASRAADERTDKNSSRQIVVALAGNPNAGKTSLFNALTGLRQKVANYPGVTVERKEGLWTLDPAAPPARLIDLPGLYSLEAASLDEQIARNVIAGKLEGVGDSKSEKPPDVIIAVVDATNLARNLYLATQLLETGRPLVVALTMMDEAEKRGLKLNVEKLSAALRVPVVPVNAVASRRHNRRGLSELARVVAETAKLSHGAGAGWRLSDVTENEIENLIEAKYGVPTQFPNKDGAQTSNDSANRLAQRVAVVRALFADESNAESARDQLIEAARARLAQNDSQWWQELVLARYEWVERIARECLETETASATEKVSRRESKQMRARRAANATQKIDRIVTHRIFGPVILLAVMLIVFQTIFSWANLPMDLIDKTFGALGDFTRAHLPAGLLTDLLVDGVIAGVGGVIVFLPQILLLFFFISLLEDSGYMARAAFLMDRLMRGVGLHGKAFMPLLSSFACAIPGIMATRTIENPKDRIATIMIAPFMSCSARLPVYTLMIAAFFTGRKFFGVISVGAVIIMAMYLLGIAVAVCVAWILKRTILKAPPPPLVLELPPYRTPNLFNILHAIWTRAALFLKRAGTVILAISILLWALVTFPRTTPTSEQSSSNQPSAVSSQQKTETPDSKQSETGNPKSGIENSFAGRLGHLIEPAIKPLGFDWRMGIGLISSFAARETLVSTLSIVYNVNETEKSGKGGEVSSSIVDAVRAAKRDDGSPAWTPLVAVSMMVFFVLACQCMSTVAVVRRETNSWRWALFMVGYMLALAYIASLITYQGGRFLGLG